MTEPHPASPAEAVSDAGAERRAWVRHPSTQKTLCQQTTAQTDDVWFLTALREVSQTGLSLVVNRPFEPGSVLAIEPIQTGDGLTRLLHVRVIHARASAKGGWVLGCEFTSPLSGAELQTLLEPSP